MSDPWMDAMRRGEDVPPRPEEALDVGLESRAVFGSWSARQPGAVRSLDAARAVLSELLAAEGLPAGGLPAVVVTGSKGKGQAATTAAAHLSARGFKTGLVTSPGILSNLDRFALDGRVVPAGTYNRWLAALDRAVRAVGVPDGAYLAPTGLFTVLGHAMLAAEGADVVVHEAGLGGAHDEVSIFNPLAVGFTSVLREHLDLFGPTLEHVAREKFGLVHGPAPVVSVPQEPRIVPMLERACAEHGAPLSFTAPGPFGAQNAEAGRRVAEAAAVRLGEPTRREAPDLTGWEEAPALGGGRAGAVGRSGGSGAAGRSGGSGAVGRSEGPGAAGRSDGSGASVRTEDAGVVVERPGRGQVYQAPGGGRVMVDACIDRAGWEVALRRSREAFGADPLVYWSLPMTKGVEELADWLDAQGLRHRFVSLESGHLDYRLPAAMHSRLSPLPLRELLRRLEDGPADDAVLAAGTISFGTEVLRALGVTIDTLYRWT